MAQYLVDRNVGTTLPVLRTYQYAGEGWAGAFLTAESAIKYRFVPVLQAWKAAAAKGRREAYYLDASQMDEQWSLDWDRAFRDDRDSARVFRIVLAEVTDSIIIGERVYVREPVMLITLCLARLNGLETETPMVFVRLGYRRVWPQLYALERLLVDAGFAGG